MEKKFIDQTLNDINTSKLTLNDVVYKEVFYFNQHKAQKKVCNIFRSTKSQVDHSFGFS